MNYPNLARPDSGYILLDIPAMNYSLSAEERRREENKKSSSSTVTKALAVLLVSVSLVLGLGALSRQQDAFNGLSSSPWMASSEENEDSAHSEGYSVDVSWPIKGPLGKEETPFGEGVRHDAYMKHLSGCRSFYKQVSETAARTCDLFEFDRLLMNKRQPMSMEVSTVQ